VLIALVPWAGASCPEIATGVASATSLADLLGASNNAVQDIACIDAVLMAGLGTSNERAQLQLKIAVWLEEAGKYREARARLRAASALLPHTDSNRQRTAIGAQFGWVEYRLGNFDSAEHALAEAAATDTASPLEHATILDHLGVVQRERNSYLQAEHSFSRALTLAQSDPGPPGQRMQAQIYNDRGGLRTYQSDFRSAVEDFQHALGLYRALGMGQMVEAAKTLNNLGNAHRELGDTARARTELEQALDLKTVLLGPQHPSTASTINNLGMVAEEAHDYVGAEAYYARALEIYEKTLGSGNANVASVASQYGRLRSTTGNYPGALRLLERARAIRERTFGIYSNWSAETLVDLVPVYSQLGQRSRALRGAERAISIAVTAQEQELLYDCYMSYARALAAQGQSSAAIFFGKRAINVIQQMRERDVPATKREQRSFLMQREFMYRDLADWLIRVGRLSEAEEVLDLLKTEELADYTQLATPAGEPATGRVGMVYHEVPAAASLDEAIHDLDDQLERGAARQRHAAALYARFVARLQQMVATLAVRASRTEQSRRDVDAGSPSGPHIAVIRYLVMPEQVRILLRTPAGLVDRSVAISRAALNRQVLDLHYGIQSHVSAESAARTVFKLLIAPIASDLAVADIRHLVLVPDDVLRYVPFAALQDEHGYLIESYVLSLATPAAPRNDAGKARPLRAAAAFGISHTPDGRTLLPNVPIELRRVVRRSPDDRYGALPGIILLDGAFTRANAAKALASGFPVVHIASHFVFRPGSLADSYLLLGDGTHLTLDVIKTDALPLRGVEMLTLSACDTAVGEEDADGREIESFAALAQRQGVRSVLAALWAVPDLSTSVFMARFYASLASGRDSVSLQAEALRDAQLLLLKGPTPGAAAAYGRPVRSPYADPFFWAAFVLLGPLN
jgi:CHAT domain-containing protein/Tfp pilus assembly protein PilF